MPDDPLTPDPHDRFFKETFGRAENAVPSPARGAAERLFPRPLIGRPLEREEATFLDETLARRSSDLLFTVEWAGSPTCLYCLFEHQSTSDPKMPLRLLRYMVRIWDRWEQEHPHEDGLPLIFPVVLFQGKGGWNAPPDLRGLVRVPAEVGKDWEAFVPMFQYPVVDVADAHVRERFAALHVRSILELLRSVVLEKDGARLQAAFAALTELVRCQGDNLTYIRTALSYLFRVSGDIDTPRVP